MNRIAALCVSACALAGSAQADVLWDQSSLNFNTNAHPNTISGGPPFGWTAYTAGDVTVGPGGWTVSSVTMYFTALGFDDWSQVVTSARLNIHPKSGSLPSYNPGAAPLISVSAAGGFDNDAQMPYWSVTASGLSIPLAPGDYWIGLTPVAPSGPFGPEYGLATNGVSGDFSPYWSPYTDFGMPPAQTWANASGPQDAALKVEGVPSPAGVSLIALGALSTARRRRR